RPILVGGRSGRGQRELSRCGRQRRQFPDCVDGSSDVCARLGESLRLIECAWLDPWGSPAALLRPYLDREDRVRAADDSGTLGTFGTCASLTSRTRSTTVCPYFPACLSLRSGR